MAKGAFASDARVAGAPRPSASASPARGRVVVFGSINLDLVTRVGRFPRAGETVGDAVFSTHPGGKGANQALAAARAGAAVALVGCVGDDAFATLALAGLSEARVDLARVRRVAKPTGTAAILVDAAGQNCIAVAPGANAEAAAAQLDPELLAGDAVLLVQGELPVDETRSAIASATRAGARIVLNLAPPIALPREAIDTVDCLIVNEHEAAELGLRLGLPGDPAAFALAQSARSGGVVVVTLGAGGALAVEGSRTWRLPAPAIEVVDTTGAGDAFVGAFVAEASRRTPLPEALRFALAAGSLACTALGAQTAIARREAILALAATLP